MENPDLVLQETGSRPTYSRLNYVPSGDTLRRDAISSFKVPFSWLWNASFNPFTDTVESQSICPWRNIVLNCTFIMFICVYNFKYQPTQQPLEVLHIICLTVISL